MYKRDAKSLRNIGKPNKTRRPFNCNILAKVENSCKHLRPALQAPDRPAAPRARPAPPSPAGERPSGRARACPLPHGKHNTHFATCAREPGVRCTAPLFGSQAWGTPVAWNKHTRTHTHTPARSPSCWVDPGSWLPHWLTRTRAHTHTRSPHHSVCGEVGTATKQQLGCWQSLLPQSERADLGPPSSTSWSPRGAPP